MLLTGTFFRSIDEKLRIAIPRRLRDDLGCPAGGWVYVATGTDNSLAVYTEDAFSRLGDRVAKASPAHQDVRAFAVRLFYARAQRVELDRQGRIRIPPELSKLAKLEKEVAIIGVQDHLEIWPSERWASYLADKQAHFDEIAESALGGSP